MERRQEGAPWETRLASRVVDVQSLCGVNGTFERSLSIRQAAPERNVRFLNR